MTRPDAPHTNDPADNDPARHDPSQHDDGDAAWLAGLHEAWAQARTPLPLDTPREDAATRAAVAWMHRGWGSLQAPGITHRELRQSRRAGPSTGRLPTPDWRHSLRPVAAAALLALLLGGPLWLTSGRGMSRPHDSGQLASAPSPTGQLDIGLAAEEPRPIIARLHNDHFEFTSGPVRLLLFTADAGTH